MHAGSCAQPDLCIGVAEAEKGAAEHPCVCYDKEVEAAAVEREEMVEAGDAADAADAAENSRSMVLVWGEFAEATPNIAQVL